jgi:hypothetical protein
MAAMQAFLDDSGMGQAPASVIGGFVSTTERWKEFSSEWQDALDVRPAIAYFKMKEANGLRGEFKGWSADRRDERIALLFSIIERHAMFGVSSAIQHEMYNAIFRGRLSKPTASLEYPYFILFHGVVTSIAQHLAKSGHAEPIDFVFDTQPDQMKKMLKGWELFVSRSGDAHRALIKKPPVFRDDKRALPLQAADLHAWWVRKMCEAYLLGKPERKPPFPQGKESLSLPVIEMFWRQDALQRMYASLSGTIPIALRPLKKQT